MLVLYTGILLYLSKLMGYISESRCAVVAFEHMWIFNFVIVLLASIFFGTLLNSIAEYAANGLCSFLQQLGSQIPNNSRFFTNYMIGETLALVPLLDYVQVWGLVLALPEAVWAAGSCLPGELVMSR